MVYFRKERVSNAIKVNGQLILWEMVSRDTGVRQFNETKDAEVIAVLNGFADSRKMGVVRISPQIYDSQKKRRETKTTSKPLPKGFGQAESPIRVMDRESVLVKPKPAAPASVSAPVAARAVAEKPVVEASPPPPNKPLPPAAPPAGVTAPKPPVKPGPVTAAAATALNEPAVKTPEPPKRTRAKKSDIEAKAQTAEQQAQ